MKLIQLLLILILTCVGVVAIRGCHKNSPHMTCAGREGSMFACTSGQSYVPGDAAEYKRTHGYEYRCDFHRSIHGYND